MKSSDYNKEQYSLGLLIQQVSKTNLPAIHERNIICTRSGINQAKQYFSNMSTSTIFKSKYKIWICSGPYDLRMGLMLTSLTSWSSTLPWRGRRVKEKVFLIIYLEVNSFPTIRVAYLLYILEWLDHMFIGFSWYSFCIIIESPKDHRCQMLELQDFKGSI